MKYIITEDQEKRLAKRIPPKKNLYDEILDYLNEYITKGCVKFNVVGKYMVASVGAPYDFVDAGFERQDADRVKGKLRGKGFISLGVGEFAKEM